MQHISAFLSSSYTHIHTCTNMYKHVHTCTHMYTHAHTYTHMYTHVHTFSLYLYSLVHVCPLTPIPAFSHPLNSLPHIIFNILFKILSPAEHLYIPPTYMYSQRNENGGVSLSQYRGASLAHWMSTLPF